MAEPVETSATYSYYLPDDVAEWVADRAKQEDRSASWFLKQLIRAAMDAERAQKDSEAA